MKTPMDITPFIDSLQNDLTRAADVGDEAVRAAALRLSAALDPALRLTLMSALSQAAAEISAELDQSSIEVRLQGRDPVFVVTGAAPAPPPQDEPEIDDSGDAVARITFRLPETLKARAEELAARRGQSLNTWLVSAARAAAQDGRGPESGRGRHHSHGKRVQGWAR
jgi:hypothetical protein